MILYLLKVNQFLLIQDLNLLLKILVTVTTRQLIYLKLFELFRVITSNIAVEVFHQNYEFDFLLDVDNFLDQIKQLILVVCIFEEATSRETDQTKVLKLCDVPDYTLFSRVRTGQVKHFGNFARNFAENSDSSQRDLENPAAFNLSMSIEAKIDCFGYNCLYTDLFGTLNSKKLRFFGKDEVYDLMNVIVSLIKPVLVLCFHDPFKFAVFVLTVVLKSL